MTGHTKDTCWDIHGKPSNWKLARERRSRGNLTAIEDTATALNPSLFSKKQIEWLQNTFGKTQLQAFTIAAGSIAHKGNPLHVFTAKSKPSTLWIVDSRVSDHMTRNSALLTNFQPCDKDWKVRIGDGSLSKVAGIGSVVLSTSFTLHAVLFVPNLDCNLLSISKLTIDMDCVAKFSKDV